MLYNTFQNNEKRWLDMNNNEEKYEKSLQIWIAVWSIAVAILFQGVYELLQDIGFPIGVVLVLIDVPLLVLLSYWLPKKKS